MLANVVAMMFNAQRATVPALTHTAVSICQATAREKRGTRMEADVPDAIVSARLPRERQKKLEKSILASKVDIIVTGMREGEGLSFL